MNENSMRIMVMVFYEEMSRTKNAATVYAPVKWDEVAIRGAAVLGDFEEQLG